MNRYESVIILSANASEEAMAAFGEKMNTPKNYSLKEALCITGIQSEPGEHDGLIDAINTAKIFAKIKKDKENEDLAYLRALKEAEKISYETNSDIVNDIYNWYYSKK